MIVKGRRVLRGIRTVFAVALGVLIGQFGWLLIKQNSNFLAGSFFELSTDCGGLFKPCYVLAQAVDEVEVQIRRGIILRQIFKDAKIKNKKPKNPFDALDDDDLLKGLKPFNLKTAQKSSRAAKREEEKTQQRTFAGYPCKKLCIGHRAGFLWARKNKITITQTCRNTSVSFSEGCRFYLLEKNFNPNKDDQGNIIPGNN